MTPSKCRLEGKDLLVYSQIIEFSDHQAPPQFRGNQRLIIIPHSTIVGISVPYQLRDTNEAWRNILGNRQIDRETILWDRLHCAFHRPEFWNGISTVQVELGDQERGDDYLWKILPFS